MSAVNLRRILICPQQNRLSLHRSFPISKLQFSNAIYPTSSPKMDAQYTRFVQELHSQIPVDRTQVEFRQGSNAWFSIAIGGMAIISLAILFVAVLFFQGELGEVINGRPIRFAGLVFTMIATYAVFIPLLKRGTAKPYAANDLPAKYLPE